jgi:hypothetical protein
MLRASPQAIEWFEKETGKTLIQHYLGLFQSTPIHQAVDNLPNDHPGVDDLVESLSKRIKSDRKQHKALQDLSILIDYRWMTEGLGGKHLETTEKLGEKYHIDPVRIYAINAGLSMKV